MIVKIEYNNKECSAEVIDEYAVQIIVDSEKIILQQCEDCLGYFDVTKKDKEGENYFCPLCETFLYRVQDKITELY